MKDVNDFMKDLQKLEKAMKQDKTDLLDKAADNIIKKLEEKTPAGEHELQKSWSKKKTPNGVEVGSELDYAPNVEYGGRTKEGRIIEGAHMMRDTVNEVGEDVEKMIDDLIKGIFE